MTTTPTSSSTATTGSSSTTNSSSSALNSLSSDYNTFLTLLTTQLQNQDPLNPMDSSQFTQQLVEFASVQQEVGMNSNLQTLISLQQTSEATAAMQFLGSNVTVNGSTATLANSQAQWSLTSPSPATAKVTITNSSGQTVYTGTTSLSTGTQTYTWNGMSNGGVSEPAGQYTIAVTATGASGQAVTVTTQTQGTVTGVDLSSSPPTLTVGGQNVAISAIQSINSGASSALSSMNGTLSSLNSTLNSLLQLL